MHINPSCLSTSKSVLCIPFHSRGKKYHGKNKIHTEIKKSYLQKYFFKQGIQKYLKNVLKYEKNSPHEQGYMFLVYIHCGVLSRIELIKHFINCIISIYHILYPLYFCYVIMLSAFNSSLFSILYNMETILFFCLQHQQHFQ